jgi:hypothetical protein
MADFPTLMALGGSAAAVAQVLVWRCDQRRMSSSDSNGEAGRDAGGARRARHAVFNHQQLGFIGNIGG